MAPRFRVFFLTRAKGATKHGRIEGLAAFGASADTVDEKAYRKNVRYDKPLDPAAISRFVIFSGRVSMNVMNAA